MLLAISFLLLVSGNLTCTLFPCPVFGESYNLFLSISVITSISCSSTSSNFPFNKTEKISDILSSPSKYSDKLVNVKGKVTDSFIALEMGYFVLSDGTGSIVVIPSKTFPKVGEEVKIKGTVKNAFVIGDKSLTVIVEERENDKNATN